MISIVFASDAELVRQLVAVLAVASVVVAALLAHAGRGGRVVAGGAAVLGLIVVLGLTLSPVGGLEGDGCATDASSPLDDVPNVLLFFVPVLFAVVATRRPLTMLLAGPAVSVAIEFAQDVLPELGRRCDVNDVLANSAGAAGGVLMGAIILLTTFIGRRGRGAPVGTVASAATRAEAAQERELHRLR
ncbi:VanZ family protein [Labedella endophytica]|nr:VanZ family protein [Labedella endophytica]